MRRLKLAVRILFAGSLAAAAEVMTLPEVIETAIRSNLELAGGRIRQTFPEFQRQIALADFQWRLRPGIALEQDSDLSTVSRVEGQADRRFSTGALFQMRAEWTRVEDGEDRELLEARVEQPLFQNFGQLSAFRNVDAASFQAMNAQWAFHRETEALILRVVEAYTGIVFNQQREIQEADALARSSDFLHLVELRERQGRATAVEVLEMKLLHQQAELRYRRVREELEQGKLTLAELMGRVPEQLPDLAPVPFPEEDLPTPSEADELAREHRTERMQALAAYEEARRNLRLQRRESYPDVRVIASYRPDAMNEDESWFAGISAARSLDSHILRLREEQEEAGVQAALLDISAVELRLNREVRQGLSDLKQLKQEVELAELQQQLSEQRLKLARGLYPGGRATANQLREAEEQWIRSEIQRSELELARVRAHYRFRQTLGLLLGAPAENEEAEENPLN